MHVRHGNLVCVNFIELSYLWCFFTDKIVDKIKKEQSLKFV